MTAASGKPRGGQGWSQSAEWREIGRAAISEFNRRFWAGPKCGAKARTTGCPCRRPALANGRCYAHGGATPRGDAWHRPKLCRKKTAKTLERLDQKSLKREQAAKKRAARVARMTPEQLDLHQAWHRTHKPGKSSDRAASRAAREQAAFVRRVVDAVDAGDQRKLVDRTDGFRNFHEGVFG